MLYLFETFDGKQFFDVIDDFDNTQIGLQPDVLGLVFIKCVTLNEIIYDARS